MTKEQEIRAFALAIAVLNNEGSFFQLLKGKDYVIEFNGQQTAYLKAVEKYIEAGLCREVSNYAPELKNLI
ncbi:hypothetical protein R84B8_01831 [Treponema sp. R8-4-B8]